jgi:SpoVK/Ycf46/Vps4 family AAA+-type ATPase
MDCTSLEQGTHAQLQNRDKMPPIFALQDLAARSEGYTGADIAAVCREACLAALEESLSAQQVAGRHFLAALATVPASAPASAAMAAAYERFERQGRIDFG